MSRVDEASRKEGLLLRCEGCHCWRIAAFLMLEIPGLSAMLCDLEGRSDPNFGWHVPDDDEHPRYKVKVQ